jgi:dolichol-phosphate mannosyltransferase
MRDAPPDISLVIPLFNEQEVFAELCARLETTVAQLAAEHLRAEVVLVDDGSADATPELIAAACARLRWCRGVVLSRNFGHQIALTAGMQHACGASVALLDGDLQDPPEAVLALHAKLREGFDVVYAIRRARKENILKRAAYAGFYRLMQRLATVPIPLDSGDFCLMTRRVCDTINAMPERHRFIRGMRSWVGFRQTGAAYERAARRQGQSKYSMGKLVRLAFDGIFTFSERPLQWSTMLGLIVATLSFAWGLYVVIWRLISPGASQLAGWATLAAAIMFLGGVQLISIGILGEYIGRIHNEVKARPLYIVQARHGFDRTSAPQPRAAVQDEAPEVLR